VQNFEFWFFSFACRIRFFCLLYPSSPFPPPRHITRAFEYLPSCISPISPPQHTQTCAPLHPLHTRNHDVLPNLFVVSRPSGSQNCGTQGQGPRPNHARRRRLQVSHTPPHNAMQSHHPLLYCRVFALVSRRRPPRQLPHFPPSSKITHIPSRVEDVAPATSYTVLGMRFLRRFFWLLAKPPLTYATFAVQAN
jgi:hypothetical protein